MTQQSTAPAVAVPAGPPGAPVGAAPSARMPSQIKYIIGNEGCERFSFYGMRSILVVFMTDHLLFSKPDAQATFHLFVSAVYLLPLLGAVIADRYLGKYRTIMYLSLVYCAGHGVLALFEGTSAGLYAGLGLIALGSGGIKPCVSAFVGDQFTKRNKHLVKKVFDWFYWIINFGSFFATLLIPWTLAKAGPAVAFGIPGILMFIATVIYYLGRKQYIHVPPTGKNPNAVYRVVGYAWANRKSRKPGESFLDVARRAFPEDAVEGVKAALRVAKVFATVSIFWALFDQHSSSWVLQAKQMELHGMKASQIAALNPIMVMVLIPLFAKGIYPWLERKGFSVTPLKKMTTGMFVAGFSFVIVAIYQALIDQGVHMSVWWQAIPFLIITAAEVLISITGLEFAYTQAPRAMKSTIMSFWLLTVFLGNLLTAYVSKINVFEGAWFFVFFAALMLVVGFVFMAIAARYKVVEYFEEDTAAA